MINYQNHPPKVSGLYILQHVVRSRFCCIQHSILICCYIISFFLEIQLSKEINRTNTNPVVGVAWLEENIYVVHGSSNIVYVHPDQESIDGSKDGNIELEGMKIRGIWWPANSVDRYSSATVTTDVYGGFRCLEERSVDGRWMEDHTGCRSVHRMCWSWMLFVMVVDI